MHSLTFIFIMLLLISNTEACRRTTRKWFSVIPQDQNFQTRNMISIVNHGRRWHKYYFELYRHISFSLSSAKGLPQYFYLFFYIVFILFYLEFCGVLVLNPLLLYTFPTILSDFLLPSFFTPFLFTQNAFFCFSFILILLGILMSFSFFRLTSVNFVHIPSLPWVFISIG